MLSENGQVPALAAEDPHHHSRSHNRIDLAAYGHDQRRFSAPVGAENRHVLPGPDRQVHIVKHHTLAARHIHRTQLKKLVFVDPGHFPPRSIRRAAADTPVRLNGLTTMSDTSKFLLPQGFKFGATKAGLKKSGRTDFAFIVADAPASAAAAFTANRVTAAPLIVDRENLRTS